MEMANCEVGNVVGVKLPIGFRFRPTDEEVLLHYLNRKVCSLPLPAAAITEFDVFHSAPWDLPGDLKEKRYFFCKRKRSPPTNKFNSSSSSSSIRRSFSTDCGYWKAIGRDKQIMAPGCNRIIGIKKSFVFCQRKKSFCEQKTQWVMHELCLVASINTPFLAQKLMVQVGEWVVCRVQQRSIRKTRNHGNGIVINAKKSGNLQGICAGDHTDWRMESKNELGFSSSSTSTSSSSGITEISTNELDQEESSHSVSF